MGINLGNLNVTQAVKGTMDLASKTTFGAKAVGVALAYKNEIDTFFQNKFGFSIFGDSDKCKINNIELEWVNVTEDNRSSSVKTHSLEDRESTLISSNLQHSNRKYGITVMLTNIGTKNAEGIYEQIVELWQKKQICTISTTETIEDIVITKVSRKYKHETVLEFELDFEVLEFAYFMRKGEILESESTILKDEQKTGVAGTSSSGLSFGGFLK